MHALPGRARVEGAIGGVTETLSALRAETAADDARADHFIATADGRIARERRRDRGPRDGRRTVQIIQLGAARNYVH